MWDDDGRLKFSQGPDQILHHRHALSPCPGLDRQLGTKVFDLASHLWFSLLRPGDDGGCRLVLGYFSFWLRGLQTLSPAGGSDDCGWAATAKKRSPGARAL